MRSIWSGALSFGLVNIPVRLYSATANTGLSFDFLHKKDLSPIRYARVCKAEGKEIPYEEIVRGYEYQKGDYIVLTDEDFKKANLRKTKTIDIFDFAQEKNIDSIYFEKPYYLEPDGSDKAYALLSQALRRSGKVGLAKFVLRNREHLAMLKPAGKLLILNQLRFAEELNKPDGLKLPGIKAEGKEVDMALALIDQLSGPFKPEKYKDTYTSELTSIIEHKAKGKRPKAKGKAPELTPVSDLMATLRASLEKSRAREKVEA